MAEAGPIRKLRFLPGSDVLRQVEAASYIPFFTERKIGEYSLSGQVELRMIAFLRRDERFAKGGLHRLHPEVGQDRIDFRAWSGTFGRGSLQIVIDKKTGRCYCDVDRFNPYQDLVNIIGHSGEVIYGWWQKLKGK